jgi:arylformamidase
MTRIHDITLTLGTETAIYPGDPAFARQVVRTHAADGCELSALHTGAHAGTHVDAPAHFIPGGKRLDDYGLERFVLEAVVIEVADRPIVAGEDFDPSAIPDGGAVLFKTDNSITGRVADGVFHEDFVALAPDAAKLCLRAGATLVGIDAPSIDPPGAAAAAHKILLAGDVLLLEAADLRRPAPGRYRLTCPPLKIPDAEGCCVRAFLTEL